MARPWPTYRAMRRNVKFRRRSYGNRQRFANKDKAAPWRR